MAEIREAEMRAVLSLINLLDSAMQAMDSPSVECYVDTGTLKVRSKNDYEVGTLVLEDDHWKLVLEDEPKAEPDRDVNLCKHCGGDIVLDPDDGCWLAIGGRYPNEKHCYYENSTAGKSMPHEPYEHG